MFRPQPLAVFAFPNSIPHVLKNVDPQTKNSCKIFYRKVKKGIVIGSISGICIYELGQLLCDLAKSKLILRGYRNLFYTSFAPMFEVGAAVIYIGTNAKKARLIAKTLSEVGLSIWRGQQEIGNVLFFCSDIVLFGELISITEDTPLSIFGNETESNIDNIIQTLGDN